MSRGPKPVSTLPTKSQPPTPTSWKERLFPEEY